MLEYYLRLLKKDSPLLPVIIDPDALVTCVSHFVGHDVTEEEVKNHEIPSVYFYRNAEDPEKSISIRDIRRLLTDIEEKPYTGRNMYIIDRLDTARLEAMNALLKILEEPPPYAIIIITVENPESIIETIRSRTLVCTRGKSVEKLWDTEVNMLRDYFHGEPIALLEYISEKALSRDQALALIIGSLPYFPKEKYEELDFWIGGIYAGSESTRHILECVYLDIYPEEHMH